MRYPLLAAAALLLTAAAPATPTAAPRSRTFLLTCKAVVPAQPAGTKQLEFWMPVPHDDKSQNVSNLRIKTGPPYRMATDAQGALTGDTLKSYTIATDQYGNQTLHIIMSAGKLIPRDVLITKEMIDKLPYAPIDPITVTLTARVTRREHLNLRATNDHAPAETEATDPNLRRWLAPDRLVPLDAKIKAQAQEVVTKAGAKTDLQKARAIYEHVVSTVTYDKTGQGWGRGDIYYACDARRGNCTDFHAIVIGYCRALGIPARFSIGLPLPAERGRGEVKGYHCWAEFFTKQTGWVPVDASEAAKNPDKRNYFFGAHDENRVEFTRGRDLTLVPKQAGPPLNYFVYPYAEADGKPIETVLHTYTFEDVAEK
jgi:transglutaminase-like putative cysteine protease